MAAIAADPELVADFIAESHEHMDSCNGHLLAIESDPGDFDAFKRGVSRFPYDKRRCQFF